VIDTELWIEKPKTAGRFLRGDIFFQGFLFHAHFYGRLKLLDQLRAAHAETAADLRVKEEELRRKAAEVARLTQVNNDREKAGKILQKKYEKLQFANNTLVHEKEDLEQEIEEQHKALNLRCQ
jgi:alkanesulfonate monooxygenase SsuD/methylene tetrahydromethanopterin reductase-like flavin-dependent oxidoreductase (luciferase family)